MEKTIEKVANAARSGYPEVKRIQEDVDSLRGNVMGLARHLYSDGSEKIAESGEIARERFSQLGDLTEEQLLKLEGRVRSKPGQSILIAFAAGLLASLFLSRK